MQSCPRQQASTCISVVGAQGWMIAMRQRRHGRGSALTGHGAVSSCRRRFCAIGERRFCERIGAAGHRLEHADRPEAARTTADPGNG